MKKIIASLFTIFCFSSILTISIFGQGIDRGHLAGVVQDNNGAFVPNVKVTVINVDTGSKRDLTTDAEGRWSAQALLLGNYEITFEAPGFKVEKQSNVVVQATTTITINQVLGVEGVVGDVVINTDAGTVATSDTSATSSRISAKELESAPLGMRSFTQLIQTDTSASADLSPISGNTNGNQSPAIHGTRTTSSSFFYNGIDATNFMNEGSLSENISPAPETIQEVKVLTSLYDAAVGRSGGGNIQLVTKSGTNNFHGSIYYYVQNEKFNANDFFYNRDGIDRQRARRHEGGFTFGGPIIKDKFHFFGSYQKTKADTAYVPSAQSFVILPEWLAFIQGPRTPENIRLAINQGVRLVGATRFVDPGCIDNRNLLLRCIDSKGVGVKLLNLINPVTGDYFIPSPRPGAERLFFPYTIALGTGERRTLNARLTDRVTQTSVSQVLSPLVRQRNAAPAKFEQDQFTTRLDYSLSPVNTLSGTFFFAKFPSLDPFPDFSLTSPTTLKRDLSNRTLALSDTHVFSGNLVNEARFGYFFLNNTRRLDDPFLADELTSAALGIDNPARFYEPGDVTRRLSRFTGTGQLDDFSVGAPNDIFNRREQTTMTFADNVTWTRGSKTFRFGVEAKRHAFDTNLPEEQGGEFEKYFNFGQILNSISFESDTQFGITDKQFRFGDLSFYVTDDWKVNDKLTLNLGVRWDWFGLPTEKNGRFANFDFDRVTDPNNIGPGFILPSNVTQTGFPAIDVSTAQIEKVNNKHTLNGQDLNNFAPRIGFAFSPLKSGRTVIRGGYGVFFDRPSAAFMNTIYSNYPFLREIETVNRFSPGVLPVESAFSDQNPNTPFSSYLPFRIIPVNGTLGGWVIYDNTPGVRRTNGGIRDPRTGQLATGNLAETLEFRAIDRNLKTPYVQQWNIGVQQQFGSDWLVEVRYVGTKGTKLLQGIGFNQAYDLNDPNTPDYIFKRLNDVYQIGFDRREGCCSTPLRTGVSERERGRGIAYGYQFESIDLIGPLTQSGPIVNALRGVFDYNLVQDQGIAIIPYDVRAPYLGFSATDAVVLRSNGNSIYHSGQINVTKRLSKGFQFTSSYTWAKSMDTGSTDPGSTVASGRPDSANLGLVLQGDQRNIDSNRAVSDFDRPHRFSTSFVWDIPSFGSKSRFLNGWQISGFGQWQSGTPFSIYASEPEIVSNRTNNGFIINQYAGFYLETSRRQFPGVGAANFITPSIAGGTGSIFRVGFARPSVRSLESLRRQGSDPTRQYFNTCQDSNNPDCALVTSFGGFGNLGRNTLRGPTQKRFDMSLSKETRITERVALQLKWDVFNIFNLVNFANPVSDLQDETDFGQIVRTVGGPRTMQFGAKLRF